MGGGRERARENTHGKDFSNIIYEQTSRKNRKDYFVHAVVSAVTDGVLNTLSIITKSSRNCVTQNALTLLYIRFIASHQK